MLFVPNGANDFNSVVSYGTTRPSATITGTSVTPVTTNAYSNPTQIGTTLTQDCYGMYIQINSGFTATVFRQIAIRLIADYTGAGTLAAFNAGQILVDGLVGSQAVTPTLGGGVWYHFPVFIPAGTAVGVAARSSVTTVVGVAIRFMTAASNPSLVKRASFVQTIGLTLGAGTVTGVSVTPGQAAEGTWTSIGTTTNRTWWWQFACQHSDTSMTALNYHVDLGVGTSSTVVDTIILDHFVRTTADEGFQTIPTIIGVEKVVPAGSTIWARVQNSGTNESAGSFQIVAYGCGG